MLPSLAASGADGLVIGKRMKVVHGTSWPTRDECAYALLCSTQSSSKGVLRSRHSSIEPDAICYDDELIFFSSWDDCYPHDPIHTILLEYATFFKYLRQPSQAISYTSLLQPAWFLQGSSTSCTLSFHSCHSLFDWVLLDIFLWNISLGGVLGRFCFILEMLCGYVELPFS